MKWFLFIAGIVPSLISLVSCSVAPEDKSEKILTDTKISVMSFNIRLDGDTASHSWDYRKNGCLAMIGSVKPDLIGMQEVTPVQKNWLENQLTNYKSLGKARDGSGENTEYSLIFYCTDRFILLENSTFWLSATPDFMSKGWDGACYRICTYAKLRCKESSRTFYFFNTHIDHKGSTAQKLGLLLIRERIDKIAGNQAVVFLTGDFNMQPSNANIIDFRTYMNNLREKFPGNGDFNTGTYNNWGKASTVIDYIWYRNASPVSYQVIDSPYANIAFLSDHFPIIKEFELNN